MIYGLPYMGSKNKIASEIVDTLPRAQNFYDLFCGGCAITHCALLKNKYKKYHINDISPMVIEFFINAINGDYKDRTNWVSREDFNRLKDTDPFIKYVWSFGNRGGEYMYGKDIEDYKRALHKAIFFRDYSEALNFDLDFSTLDKYESLQDRYTEARRIIKETVLDEDIIKKDGKYVYEDGSPAGNKLVLQSLANFERTKSLNELGGVEIKDLPLEMETIGRIKRIQNLENIETSKNKKQLTYSIGDYQNVKIEPNSVIYCDIPYKDTREYASKNEFDYDRFYEWCSKQTEKVFVSSYEMPSDLFVTVLELEHINSFSATKTQHVIERLFVPKHQYSEKKAFSFGGF